MPAQPSLNHPGRGEEEEEEGGERMTCEVKGGKKKEEEVVRVRKLEAGRATKVKKNNEGDK